MFFSSSRNSENFQLTSTTFQQHNYAKEMSVSKHKVGIRPLYEFSTSQYVIIMMQLRRSFYPHFND